MSIIGTRPPLISETNFYELHHRARLAILFARLFVFHMIMLLQAHMMRFVWSFQHFVCLWRLVL